MKYTGMWILSTCNFDLDDFYQIIIQSPEEKDNNWLTARNIILANNIVVLFTLLRIHYPFNLVYINQMIYKWLMGRSGIVYHSI